MTYLALQPAGKLTGAREISEQEGIPMSFLWKVLHSLARRKLVRSFKGAGGGYQLARPGDRITLYDIAVSVDGPEIRDRCILGLETCNEDGACPLHASWLSIRDQLREMIEQTTLAHMAGVAVRRPSKRPSKRPTSGK